MKIATKKIFIIPGFIVIAWFAYVPANCQHYVTKQFDIPISNAKNTRDSVFLIETKYSATGIIVNIDVNEHFTGAYIVVRNDTLYLTPDEDGDGFEASVFSNLLTFSPPVDEFLFSPGIIQGPITFFFINSQAPAQTNQPTETKKKSDGCSEPEMIGQQEWRAGLADPDYERIPNVVHNVIIHHSAGSNTDTDYVSVVRNIYIYHTEIRGWSDIGYNYLIAQDGTIFKGRDPGDLPQDEVLGAHFCGSNTGTLGICVLGDYTALAPPDEALQSLTGLTTWKLGKDSLDPEGMFPHTLNANLTVIAGHRDGCATQCPGDSLYQRLESIRQEVLSAFESCGYSIKPLPVELNKEQGITVGYNSDEIVIHLEEPYLVGMQLYDMLGRKTDIHYLQDASNLVILSTGNIIPGTYILLLQSHCGIKTFKIQVPISYR